MIREAPRVCRGRFLVLGSRVSGLGSRTTGCVISGTSRVFPRCPFCPLRPVESYSIRILSIVSIMSIVSILSTDHGLKYLRVSAPRMLGPTFQPSNLPTSVLVRVRSCWSVSVRAGPCPSVLARRAGWLLTFPLSHL